MPVGVFDAVYENDRDLLPIARVQFGVLENRTFGNHDRGGAVKIGHDGVDDSFCDIAQVAVGFPDDRELYGRHGIRRALLLVAALVARLAQQLAMLLLSHPLATLLDDGTHTHLNTCDLQDLRAVTNGFDANLEKCLGQV